MPRSFRLLPALLVGAAALAPVANAAGPAPSFQFDSIDGGTMSSADWRGMPVLVVNTASMCGFTPQYTDLQALSDRYAGKAIVLAVPSDDFNQELSSNGEVKEFCALNYDLTLPMTTISHVAKADLHPFYGWLKAEQGFTPGWNFNKVLIGPDGQFVASWGSAVKPLSSQITGEIDALLR